MTNTLVAVYIHIDDFGFFGVDDTLTADVRACVRRVLESWGFILAEGDAFLEGRYVGYQPLSRPPRWVPASCKFGPSVPPRRPVDRFGHRRRRRGPYGVLNIHMDVTYLEERHECIVLHIRTLP